MSTGFDFGNQTCTIAVTRRGGIDVIANEASNRLNPSMVGFGLKERFAGEAAQTQIITNVKSTISQIKRFIGRKFSEVQDEIKRVPFVVKELPNDEIGFQVFYNGENIMATPVSTAAILLNKLKQISEKANGTSVSDVVISVPPYFTDLQRRAMLSAAEIAGLNCLRLMNETLATALYYGFYRLDLPEKDPMNVLFIDCGHSATVCSLVAFNKSKLKVVSTTFDSNLGGRDFDDLLADHFLKEFKTKYKIDVATNPRALLRLRAACERLKQVLSSGVGEAPLNIESLMDDIDVSGRMTRKDFEDLIQPLLQKLVRVSKTCLEEAGLTASQLATVEIVGGNKRVPAVQKAFSDFLGRDLMQTLNDVESVCRGCALQCAMLSPIFKVREFSITDIQQYPILLSWRPLGANHMQTENVKDSELSIFPRGIGIPLAKLVSLKQGGPFELEASYQNHELLHPRAPRVLLKATVPSLPSKPENEKHMVRVKVKINQHGLLALENVELFEAYEVDVPPPTATDAAAAAGTPSASGAAPSASAESPGDAASAEQAAASPAPAAEAAGEKGSAPAKKKKVRQTPLQFQAQTFGLSKAEVQAALEEESKMQVQDRLAFETAEARNAVESYVLGMRSKINEDLSAYATEKEREAFNALATQIEDWLYGEGDDATKSAYLDKLAEIKKLGEPVSERKAEEHRREANSHELRATLARYRKAVTEHKYDHIEQAEKDKILSECNQVESAVSSLLQKQSSQHKTSAPAFHSSELLNKKKDLERMADAILNKPKPAPTPAPNAGGDGNKANSQQSQPQPDQSKATNGDVPMAEAETSGGQGTRDVPMPDAASTDQPN